MMEFTPRPRSKSHDLTLASEPDRMSKTSRPLVEMDETAGTLRVNDPRLVTKDRRAFCRRLVDAVAHRPGVRKTVVDLASASCRVEFSPGNTDLHTMAAVFADSVREASAAARDGDGTPWWQPSTNWVALTAYTFAGEVSLWETLEASPGRIRVRHQGLSGDFDRLAHVAEAISQRDGVEACKAIPWSHRLTIDFRPGNGVADWFVDEAERSFEHLLASESHPSEPAKLLAEPPAGSGPIQVASGPARLLYLALGAGSLVMTVVGLIVPGIPTVPFLLLSSYGFARSSPRVNRWLRKTQFLGPILTEWEHHGGLSRRSKKKLIGLTVVIIVIAVILAPLSPIGLIVVLIMASLSTYGVYRLPSSPEEPDAVERAQPPMRSALSAH
jgi:uncharacterized membrane protein YbaN (DUF454 family)